MSIHLLLAVCLYLSATVHSAAKAVPMSQWVNGTASFFGGPAVSSNRHETGHNILIV